MADSQNNTQTCVCSKCRKERPLALMKKTTNGKRASWCKSCHAKSANDYYKANKAKVAIKQRTRLRATLDRINGSVPAEEVRASISAQSKSIHERLAKKSDVNPITGCWEIRTRLKNNGYADLPVFIHKRKITFLAHRLMAAIHGGLDIMDRNMLACHRCDNRRCCNPEHIFVGTQLDNVRDAWSKGRMKVRKRR